MFEQIHVYVGPICIRLLHIYIIYCPYSDITCKDISYYLELHFLYLVKHTQSIEILNGYTFDIK